MKKPQNRKLNYRYVWVIRSLEKRKSFMYDFFRQMEYSYFARQKSLKNQWYMTESACRTRLFLTKDDAYNYFFAKTRTMKLGERFVILRRKVWLDGKYLEYWRNSERWAYENKK